MRMEHLKYLACPDCGADLTMEHAEEKNGLPVETGILKCIACGAIYPIVRSIPRFVSRDNYAAGFGVEWTNHAKTQYDSYSGCAISEKRFFSETEWPKNMRGQAILEVGSGSGRFTEQIANTGAMAVSMDLSDAVEANYASNGHKENVLIVQGDVYRMPFKNNFFDKLLCFGMIQHTPRVKEAFMSLPQYLKSGGEMAVDVYDKGTGLAALIKRLFSTKYWVRPVVRNVPPEKLYRWCASYVKFMWPLSMLISRIPYFGIRINLRLLTPNYNGIFDLKEHMLKQWAILDAFDMLSPAYDFPQSIATFRKWFEDAGMRDVYVRFGHNGIEGRGKKP